ncbi:glycosyltransferase family 39 protein [Mycobacterium sp.]|uniref:glycosyltransferase family 39 protein n=1 Tax=Mycobacterium sp. TaxID=1785 RepID=UPI003D13CB59
MTDRSPQPSTFVGSVDSGGEHFPPGNWLDPCLIGVLAAIISLAGAGRPSFWYDEAATVSASYSRSLPQLWQMLGNVDAVEGAYYLLMHGWFDVFPPTEFWSRAPSGLAVGGTAAGVVVLSKFFVSRNAAIASGVVCAILPRTTWAGIEARPYALSMMAAVWLTMLLVYAAQHEKAWAWVYYGTVLALSALLDVYVLLLVVAHGLYICAFQRRRTVLAGFAVTSGLAGCAVTPLLIAAVGQAHQIGWISPVGYRTVEDVIVQQYFERSPPFALLSLVVVVTTVALAVKGSVHVTRAARQLLTLAVAWFVIPTALIVGWSGLVHPIYTPRYLAFTAPALALVLGICVAALASRPWAVAALLSMFTIAAAPNYVLAQRNSYAKYGMDYSQVADLIGAKAAPGDCLLVNDTVTFMPAPMRPLLAARPDAYRKLIDLTLWQRAIDRNDVFDTNLIPEVVAKPLTRCGVVWIITQADASLTAHQQGPALAPGPLFGATPAFAVPHDLGFRLVERWQFNLAQVIEAVR